MEKQTKSKGTRSNNITTSSPKKPLTENEFNLYSGINTFMPEKDIGNPSFCIHLDKKTGIDLKQKLYRLAKDDSKFKEQLNDGLAEVVNKSIMLNYKYYFKFLKEDEETFTGIITKEDVKRIKEQLGDKPRKHNIENASYEWQMFLFEVIKIIKDEEISLSIDRFTWDAGLIVLYAAYPDYLNHKNEEGQKDVLSGYVPYRQVTPLFPK